ncbi:MAG: hypothetical protein Q9174_000829 [Haloplaca sp. 1 TL-2023]
MKCSRLGPSSSVHWISKRSPVHQGAKQSTQRIETAASTYALGGWRPFHVFRVKPLVCQGGSSMATGQTPSDPIIVCQYALFRSTKKLCIRAAEKYLQSQAHRTSAGLLFNHGSIHSLQRHPNLNNDRWPGSNQSQMCEDYEFDDTLMEVVQRIICIQLERATFACSDSEAAIAEVLKHTMDLLTWAEQVQSIAKSGGYGMRDVDIVEAVMGARKIICWTEDEETENEFDDIWGGKFIHGGLVLGEEELNTSSI